MPSKQVETDYGAPATWQQVQALARAARGALDAASTLEGCALSVAESDFVSRAYLAEKGQAFSRKAKALVAALRSMGVEVE